MRVSKRQTLKMFNKRLSCRPLPALDETPRQQQPPPHSPHALPHPHPQNELVTKAYDNHEKGM